MISLDNSSQFFSFVEQLKLIFSKPDRNTYIWYMQAKWIFVNISSGTGMVLGFSIWHLRTSLREIYIDIQSFSLKKWIPKVVLNFADNISFALLQGKVFYFDALILF